MIEIIRDPRFKAALTAFVSAVVGVVLEHVVKIIDNLGTVAP